eukprot:gene19165-25009_t
MSSIFKFRISGQGKNFFGDGMAVWIVQNAYYTEGSLHGFIEKYVGIGVIFDTFKNTENLAIHRDVTILINDGEKTYETMTQEVQGCNINVRYHNERADFSVTDMSKARITVDDNHRLQVLVDAKNTGEWTTCVDITDLPLQKDWLKKAYVGITATTGQLADNHDVISLTSYSDYEVMEKVEEEKDNKRLFESFPGKDFDERITRLEETMNDVLTKFNVLDHHIEHEFVAANDHIDNMIAKLNSKEESAETRIEDLESLVKKQVEGRYPISIGMQYDMTPPIGNWGMPLDQILLPKVLKENGYSTHMLGKWHLGHYTPQYLPSARGFDTYLGYLTAYQAVHDPFSDVHHFTHGIPNKYLPHDILNIITGLTNNQRRFEQLKTLYLLDVSIGE